MLETLRQWDRSMFENVNQSWSNRVFDTILPWTRYPMHWVPLYVALAAFLTLTLKKKSWLPIVSLLITILLSDQFSASLIKKAVHRLRPCNNPDMVGHVTLRIENCGAGYSFVSSHASNHFAMGIFLCLFFFPRFKYYSLLWILWAATISFAQIYVGVHYPIDVFAGALLGTIVGSFVFYLMKKAERKLWPSA